MVPSITNRGRTGRFRGQVIMNIHAIPLGLAGLDDQAGTAPSARE